MQAEQAKQVKEAKQAKKSKKNQEFHFYIQLNAGDLWLFSMYYSNRGYMGLFNVIFTVAAIILIFLRWDSFTFFYRWLLAFCATLFPVWQPLLLFTKARRQAVTGSVKDPEYITVSNDGIKVEQTGESVELNWDDVAKIQSLFGLIMIYTDRIHAFLLPGRYVGDAREPLYDIFRNNLPKSKLKHIKDKKE